MKKRSHRNRTAVLIVLLAFLCVSTAELIACRHFAPAQYELIAAPVRRCAQAAAGFCAQTAQQAAAACAGAMDQASAACAAAADHAVQLWSELTAPRPQEAPEELPEESELSDIQIADGPVPMRSAPIADPIITAMVDDGGQDILTGGVVDMVYFNQGDETWADQLFGTDPIGSYGCGPTALAMIVSSMTDTETDPALMSQWAVDNGYWARRGGSYLSIVEGVEDFGLEVEPITERTPDAIANQLFSGNMVVALMGPGHFTRRGHFIVVRGATLSGELLVADPNSPERSLTTWDPQIILDELSTSTSDGAPLWSVGLPSGLSQ